MSVNDLINMIDKMPSQVPQSPATPPGTSTAQSGPPYKTSTGPVAEPVAVPESLNSVPENPYLSLITSPTTVPGEEAKASVPAPAPAPAPTSTPPTAPPAPQNSGASTVSGKFDFGNTAKMISSNEKNYGTTVLKPGVAKPKSYEDFQPSPLTYTPDEVNAYFNAAENSPEFFNIATRTSATTGVPYDQAVDEIKRKREAFKSYSGIPDPLKEIATDQLFNSSYDPRISALIASGAIPYNKRLDYTPTSKKDAKDVIATRDLLEKTWNENKDLINQQYTDDPEGFTDYVNSFRDIAYQNIGSNQMFPGPSYKYAAWKPRTEATYQNVKDRYFNPAQGYVAPQFFQKYGGSYRKGDVVYMSDSDIAEFIRNGGQIEEME
jgi:hypothetical protein